MFLFLRSKELFTVSRNGVVGKGSLLFRKEESGLSCEELAAVPRYGLRCLTFNPHWYILTIVHIFVCTIEPLRGAMITPRAIVLFQVSYLDLCL